MIMDDPAPPSKQVKYQEIAGYFKREIEQGRLLPDTKLGSLQELAERFNCVTETVRNAIAVLRLDGLVVSRHGVGNFVTPREKWKSTAGSVGDTLSGPVVMAIDRLVDERDEQVAGINATLSELGRSLAGYADQFTVLRRQLDTICRKLSVPMDA